MHLRPNDLRFEHVGAKLASCPERHLTSLRPGGRQSVGIGQILGFSALFTGPRNTLCYGCVACKSYSPAPVAWAKT